MPTIAGVAAVKIQLYPNDHPPAHFHGVLAGYRIVVDIGTMRVVAGSLPPSKRRAVLEWAIAHHSDLQSAWTEMQAGRKPRRIG